MTVAVECSARLPVDATDHVAAEDLENLELLVTELVTNAVRHGRLGEDGWVSVEVVAGPAAIHAEVSDPGVGFDHRAASTVAGEERGSGWGLFLVDQLSTRWGVRHDDCTRVWFDLPVSAALRLPV